MEAPTSAYAAANPDEALSVAEKPLAKPQTTINVPAGAANARNWNEEYQVCFQNSGFILFDTNAKK